MKSLPWMTQVLLCAIVLGNNEDENLSKIYSSREGIYSTANRAVRDDATAYLIVVVGSRCMCRTLCAAHARCEAYWVLPGSDGEFVCHLTEEGPFENKPHPYEGSLYGYKKKDRRHFREDGMIYFISRDTMSWNDGMKNCRSMTGYRLGIYKTYIQYDILMGIFETLAQDGCVSLNLRSPQLGSAKWGDGTDYSQYKSQDNFTMFIESCAEQECVFQLRGDDKPTLYSPSREQTMRCFYVCQSDPFNFNLP